MAIDPDRESGKLSGDHPQIPTQRLPQGMQRALVPGGPVNPLQPSRPISALSGIALLLCAAAFPVFLQAVGPSKDVKGTRIVRTLTQSGETTTPQDLTSTQISALVPDGLGGFSSIPGTRLANGTFTIPLVPKGEFWFKFGTSYVWTDEHKLDLDTYACGRPDAVPANLSTLLTFNVTGLVRFAATDILPWYVTNVNSVYGYLGDFNPTNLPLPGDTAMAGTTQDWADTGLLMEDTTKGDEPSLTQLSSVTAGAETYSAPWRGFLNPRPWCRRSTCPAWSASSRKLA